MGIKNGAGIMENILPVRNYLKNATDETRKYGNDSNFSLPLFTPIFIHIIQFHLYHSVNSYSDWLQEQLCKLSLYTLYILSVQ